MKQIIQSLKSGVVEITDVPCPSTLTNGLLIGTTKSLISSGTERMLIDFGRANLMKKAQDQPDKLKMVLEKISTDGLLSTVDSVRTKLSQPIPLGYCNVGRVLKVGASVDSFSVGDRVVSNGPHADVVSVGSRLCVRIPSEVDDETASFTVLASIGLQGIRLAEPTLGESFVVIGAGLIGLLTVQLLRAHGCRVLAIDFDDSKLALAKRFGAMTCNPSNGEDPIGAGMAFSRGEGVDGVIITASTKSNDPVSQAAGMSRKRGRIVLVGVTGLELNRADFYEKELSFQVSCSYGPGRYDPSYEDKGQDYPLPFVRWTEQRNFEAVLDMMANGQIDVKPLITHRFEFKKAKDAYQTLLDNRCSLGILLDYGSDFAPRLARKAELKSQIDFRKDVPTVGFVGAGNYASRVLIPAFREAKAQLHTVATSGGVSGVVHGRKAGFAAASTDVDEMLNNSEINTVAIVTRHDSHANFVCRSLAARKHIFVEKPLAIDFDGLEKIQIAYADSLTDDFAPQLMVGFNRRYAPQIQKMKKLLAPVKEPKSFIITVNAGPIAPDHWVQDDQVGGGRIIGEACHFIDLMRFLSDSEIISVQARRMGNFPGARVVDDRATITLGFADGSFGTIMYLANGASSFSKERVEVFAAGGVLQLDNFRRLKGYGWKGFKKFNLWKQDKGQKACVAAFLESIKSGLPAIPSAEIFEVARVSIEAAQLLREQP